MEELKSEEKQIEMCAIEKEFVTNKLNELEDKYKELVIEYNFWANVLKSGVDIIDIEKANPESTKEV